jgi:hypothetical protein
MAGLVTNFMAAASIATTAHVHQEAASALQLLEASSVPNLVIVSKTDIPQEGDSFLTRLIKNIGLTDAFTKAGVDPSRLSFALDMAQAIASPEQKFLQNGNAVFMGFKEPIVNQTPAHNSELLKKVMAINQDIDTGMIFYDPQNEDFVGRISGIEGASNKFIPGSQTDRIALTLSHESGHALAGKNERDADRVGFENYQNAARAGLDLSLDYLHAFRALRVIYDMNIDPINGTADAHTYASMNNFQWEEGADRLSDTLTPEQYKQAVTSVENALYEKIGMSIETPKERLHSLDILFPSFVLSDENKQKIALAPTQELQLKIMDAAHLSTEQKSLYLDDIKGRRISSGYITSRDQPQLTYNSALQIQSQIEKNGNKTENFSCSALLKPPRATSRKCTVCRTQTKNPIRLLRIGELLWRKASPLPRCL